ncbi:cadherin domain-containing protein [Salibacterium sp. K-3]
MRTLRILTGCIMILLGIISLEGAADADNITHDYNDEPFPGDDSPVTINVDGHEFVYEIITNGDVSDNLKLANYSKDFISEYKNLGRFNNSLGDELSIRRDNQEPFMFKSLAAGTWAGEDHTFVLKGYKDGEQVSETVTIDAYMEMKEYSLPGTSNEVDEIRIEHITFPEGSSNTVIFDNFTFDPVTNEPPVITSDDTVSVDENETAVTTVKAEDPDGDDVTFGVSGTDASHFDIDPETGELTFRDQPDFEEPSDENGDNTFEAVVTADDGERTIDQHIVIEVLNVNDNAPVITSGADVSSLEGTTDVMTVTAEDADEDSLTYEVAGGSDASRFAVDSETGELRFNEAPDFEGPGDENGDNRYEVEVGAADGKHQTTRKLTVTVTDKNEAPEITSEDTIVMQENKSDVIIVEADDPEGDLLTYSITGGADASYFDMDAKTGELRFNESPDFEEPADENGDNEYKVEVEAADGEHQTTQQVTVMITDKNDHPPEIGEETFQIKNDVTNGTVIGTINGSDPDGDEIHYSIAAGNNGNIFSVDESTGALTVLNTAALQPASSYTLTVEAGDGKHQTQADITIQTDAGSVYLENLEVSNGDLSFEPETTDYSLQVAEDVTELTVTPYASANDVTISVNGSNVESSRQSDGIPLDPGENMITIDVTGENGTKTTYELSVARAVSENDDEDESSGGSTGGSGGSSGSSTDGSENESEKIGREGGSVKMDGMSLSLPENALREEEEVTVERVTEELADEQKPEEQIIISDVFQLKKESEGPFEEPVTISIPFDQDKAHPLRQKVSLYAWNENEEWTELDDSIIQIEEGEVTGKTNEAAIVAVQASAPEEQYFDKLRSFTLRFLPMIQ